ncbi:MAG TPA: glycosyltransferase family 9 protein [Ignavibacteriaceae bacterium]|nr:glycosyltransferase family 9 protein [Ignavibacteriaceae bacterium]
MILKTDCRFLKGDKPCLPHKDNGVKCDDCNYYQPISFKILIIKLDAVGDVLRTTSILKPLKKKYPDSYIEWCTRNNSLELFKNNSLVDEVITIEDDALSRITAEEYDIVINLDTSKLSSAIAANASGKEKFGFVLSKKGFVEAATESAQHWLEMSAFDDVKKANQKSYQQIMYEILELNLPVEPPIIQTTEKDRAKIAANDFVKNIISQKPIIGLNVGVGTKWPSKGWPLKRWKELINKLGNDQYNLLLLGGPEETEIISQLEKEYKYLINTGCDNSLLEFAAIVDLCDLVITADTMALHIATALEKKIIALFGPTSANEIELYGKGIKLFSPEGCSCYYRKYCSEEISCMERITGDMVVDAIDLLMKK